MVITKGSPLVYEPTKYQRHLWRYHKMVDSNADAADRTGRERYEAFEDFSDEIYHRLYAEEPKKMEEPAPGSDVFQKLHTKMGEVPEFNDFREQCKGNDQWSGIGTAAMIDTLLASLPESDSQLQDVRGDEDVQKYLENLKEKTEDEKDQEALQETIDSMNDPNDPLSIPSKKSANSAASNLIDDTAVRNAVRSAIETASAQIQEEQEMVDSFSVGSSPHSGRKAQMKVHKELSEIVSSNSRLKKIAKLAGRMRRIAAEQQRQKPQKGTDEVTGIEMGDNLSKLVPSEALYTDEEVEMVFASKLLEKSLLNFELERTPKKEEGPIAMVLDSSGSMRMGDADIWAAAVSLAFLEIAIKKKRPFVLIHFGLSVLRIDHFDNWNEIDYKKILKAVSFFASDGGTNFEEPMSEAIRIISNSPVFEDADIIMVTDGCAPVSDEWIDNYEMVKEELRFKCYSILVGNSTRSDTNEKFSDETVHLSSVLKNDESMHKFFQRV